MEWKNRKKKNYGRRLDGKCKRLYNRKQSKYHQSFVQIFTGKNLYHEGNYSYIMPPTINAVVCCCCLTT